MRHQAVRYQTPSTFTFVGRHLSGLAIAARYLRRTHGSAIALLGSGPLEPLSLSRLMSNQGSTDSCNIICVDREPRMLELWRDLSHGMAVSCDQLADACHNILDTGEPRFNSNLLDEQTLSRNLEYYSRLTGHSDWLGKDGDLRWCGGNPISTTWHIGNAPDALEQRVDVVYCGTITVNLAKTMTRDQLKQWAVAVSTKINPTGLMVLGLTPAELSSQSDHLQWLFDAGFKPLYWFFEQRVILAARDPRGVLHGDLAMVMACPGTRLDSAGMDLFQKTMEFLQKNGEVKTPEVLPQLEIEVRTDGTLPIAGLLTEEGWVTWSAPMPRQISGLQRWSPIQDNLIVRLQAGSD